MSDRDDRDGIRGGHPFGRPRNGANGGGTNGHRTAGPHGVPNRPIPFPAARAEDAEYADEPLDLVAVQADDELISALAAGMTVSAPGHGGYDADDKVVAMLAAWKAEVDAEPLPELVDLDTAVAALESGSVKRPSSRRRHLIPLAGAAALLVFSIAGVSIGAQDADPGSPLFGVTQVLYKDAANSKLAAVEVKQRIEQVNAKLERGDTTGAQQDLQALAPLLDQVRPEEGKTYLAAEQTFLSQKVRETPAGQPTDPRAPLLNGTPRPQPSTEGDKDQDQPGGGGPASDSSSTTPSSSPDRPTSPADDHDPRTRDPRTVDPRIANVPPSPSSSVPPSSPPSSATPEGSADTPSPATPSPSTAPGGTTTTSMGSTTTAEPSTEPATTTR
ncbi:anti-sigma-D factor RsdA [Pseudonocardia kujensis]|uniref:anti-sigma-D factor RsdA n=1 Tax=Pseudonocardia kujensis TaxID=1128675 RepID=UPI0027DF24D4|nr:anti-sigma-D factor RsdA [Pseudonocardia kujensis]